MQAPVASVTSKPVDMGTDDNRVVIDIGGDGIVDVDVYDANESVGSDSDSDIEWEGKEDRNLDPSSSKISPVDQSAAVRVPDPQSTPVASDNSAVASSSSSDTGEVFY